MDSDARQSEIRNSANIRLPSLPEAFSTIQVPRDASRWRKLLAYLGPGLLVAVGYMDPGNWATDLAGGARFGYLLISVILLSNFVAMLLQHLSLKLGIATGRDLAQACREYYPTRVAIPLWILCEIGIAACDLAEVIGSAVALQLLFGLPLLVGIILTSADVFIILILQNRGFRYIECLVAALIFVIAGSFAYELLSSHPAWYQALAGLIPSPEILRNPSALYIAIGILGATVMPHNLYLHSSIVQTRAFDRDEPGKRTAIGFATVDSTVSLFFAFFINAAILILSAATFHRTGHQDVADISDAYQLLSPILGQGLASIVFAVALLASGQNSTLTGTLAGQIVMEGFLRLRLRPWVRRLITRLVAIVPAVLVAAILGESRVSDLLILSQVILSVQLSFAIFPLVSFTGNRRLMGAFVNPIWLQTFSWLIAVVVLLLNLYLLISTLLPGLRS
jgi:manganese transport protein